MQHLGEILLHLPPGQLASAAVIFFLSALLQGMTGFGFVLFSAPVLSMVAGTKVAIPLITSTAFINAIILATSNRKGIRLREIGCLLPGSFLAIPLGAWFLHHYDEAILRTGLATLIFLFAVYSLLGRVRLHLKTDLWAIPFGLLSGFSGGAFNANAPPVIVYAQLRQWDQKGFKGSLSAYLVVTSAAVMVSHHIAGLASTGIYITAIELFPVMFIGSLIGLRITGQMSTRAFNKIIQCMLIVLSLLLVVK